MTEQDEVREAVLHNILLEGQYCVTYTTTKGSTVGMRFECYPTKTEAIRAISYFKYSEAWRELAVA